MLEEPLKNVVWKKILLFLLLALNGMYPLVYFGYLVGEGPSRVIWTVIITFIILIKLEKKIIVMKKFIFFILSFLFLVYIQDLYFRNFFFSEFLNLIFLFILTYLIIYAVGKKGLLLLPPVMVFLIKVSLFFYLPFAALSLIGVDINIPDLFQANASRIDGSSRRALHYIIYNFSGVIKENSYFLIPRNSGMYWEPGAFAGSIVMVFIYLILNKPNYLPKVYKNYSMWLLIGLLSTFSTTGLITIPILFLVNFLRNKKVTINFVMKLSLLIIALSGLSYLAFINIPVLSDKITEQYEAVQNEERGSETTRMGSMILLSKLIVKEPLIGNGFAVNAEVLMEKYSFFGYEFENIGIGNGLFLFLTWTGVPFALFVLAMMFMGFKEFNVSNFIAFILILVLIILLQGESWMKLPLIYTYCFIPKSNFNDFSFYSNPGSQPS